MASFYGLKVGSQQVSPAARELTQLVDAARGGDMEAFGALFDQCYPAVYRYAYARVRGVSEAEDVAAETFAAAFRALPRFRWQGAPFEAWLFRIAASKVADQRRATARHAGTQPLEESTEPTDERDPATVVAEGERNAELMAAIERLPAPQRDVILLRFFAGRSLEEVARSMKRSVGAIKQLQFRAVARLRDEVWR